MAWRDSLLRPRGLPFRNGAQGSSQVGLILGAASPKGPHTLSHSKFQFHLPACSPRVKHTMAFARKQAVTMKLWTMVAHYSCKTFHAFEFSLSYGCPVGNAHLSRNEQASAQHMCDSL